MASPAIYFKSINPEASRTLLLVHGAISSHHEWDLVCQTGYLSSYHLLIPDLPSHGRSTSASIPFNFCDTAALLADLIAKHGKNGKADLAGMSLGAYTSIYMADKYPDIVGVGGLFVSGCGRVFPTPGSWGTWLNSVASFLSTSFLTCLPEFLLRWMLTKMGLQVNDELRGDMRAAARSGGQGIMEALSVAPGPGGEDGWKAVFERARARTCVVAGVLDDKEKECLERGRQLRKGDSASRAFKVEGKNHAWSLQDPELFARGIKAWMDGEDMPEEYVELD
jgi:pimeloyl-ACP methyl ester carboxylesterase